MLMLAKMGEHVMVTRILGITDKHTWPTGKQCLLLHNIVYNYKGLTMHSIANDVMRVASIITTMEHSQIDTRAH